MRTISSNKNKLEPVRFDFNKNQDTPDWLVKLLALSWFIGMGLLFWMFGVTNIELSQTFKLFAFFALVFTLIPFRFMQRIIAVDYYFMIAINVVGFGPLFTSLFLLLNFTFTEPIITEKSQITRYHLGKETLNQNDVIIHLENDALENIKKFRTFSSEVYYNEIKTSKYFRYTLSHGLFGYEVISNTKFE